MYTREIVELKKNVLNEKTDPAYDAQFRVTPSQKQVFGFPDAIELNNFASGKGTHTAIDHNYIDSTQLTQVKATHRNDTKIFS